MRGFRRKRLQDWDIAFAKDPAFRLEGEGLGEPAGWFLGPKAENKDLLLELITEAIEQHCSYRTSYHPEDPVIITDEVKHSESYKDAVKNLRKSTAELTQLLKRSAPIFSMRSHGHMLWDQVLPAMVGYFAGMLYNQNNVASEASPITTELEIRVGNDLCWMLGHDVPDFSDKPLPPPPRGKIVPWAHITCDGSVANIEALWAARNVKFFGVALQAALREVPSLSSARNTEVGLLDGSTAKLIDLDTWTLLNLKSDDLVGLPYKIVETDDEREQLNEWLKPYLLQHIGIVDFYQRFMSGLPQVPVVFAPATCHYSWPKAATLLGLGQNNIVRIRVDLRARMHVPDLYDQLRHCLLKRIPVIAVIAVIGSTEESAVDPLFDILEVRKGFRKEGLDFAIHCDAAWGGYFNSMYREDDRRLFAAPPELPMSDYVARQYRSLREADSITVDPHKAGFAPYPAGALCYRNSALRDVVSLAAPVVFHSQLEPTVGIYGVEGSKPGAAAAGVWLAHKTIRPNKRGYGLILGECVWVSKRMYCRLLTMRDRDPHNPSSFKIVPFQMLPAERDGLGPDAIRRQYEQVKHFVDLTNEELKALLKSDPETMKFFQELGSDQVILAYAFNFRDPSTGEWNKDPEQLNKLNNAIFEICSITRVRTKEDPNAINLILTSSSFDEGVYGSDFIAHYADRLGVNEAKSIGFLISTTMNPWTTDTPQGDFLAVVEKALRDAVYQAINELTPAQASVTATTSVRQQGAQG
jgi:glutamate/tyrosine decarboxylase-like PLP-dependent enzyme